MKLRPFQTKFIKNALRKDIDIACMSVPRGNGKSFIAAHIITRALTVGDDLFVNGKEVVQCAGSLEQARIVFGFVRTALENVVDADGKCEYRFADSTTRLSITHRATNSRLRVISSSGKTAMGLVNVPLVIGDEAGSWEVNGGQLMWDALSTALGKPGSPLRIILIGTVAPSFDGWYANLVTDGSNGSTYVMALQGDADKWDSWQEIRRCNPLVAISAEFKAKLLEERDKARADTRLKAQFNSYRLNRPMGDESQVLLTVSDWEGVTEREVPEREGRPILAVDLGGGRAWSAAVALYSNGRTEALALAPGIPSLAEQEKRDRQPRGTYTRLYEAGKLFVADGLKVQPPAQLWELARREWGKPKVLIGDRFRMAELEDAVKGVKMEGRVTMWREAAFDIRSLRRIAKDGPLAVDVDSRALLATSLSTAMVKNDESGNTRLVKKSTNNTARDDVAAALTLAAGLYERQPFSKGSGVYLGFAG